MHDHVTGVVVEGEVVLVQGGLAAVEGGLVTQGVVVGAVTNGSGHVHNGATITKLEYLVVMPASSGVRWTGSSVNSGRKLARSLSLSSLGQYGGGICFYFSSAQSIVWQ